MQKEDLVVEEIVIVQNSLGLHARPAAMLVELASRFSSHIVVQKGKTEVNGKSIMGIMMLAAGKGSKLKIKIEGSDAQEAMVALKNLIKDKFNEE